MKRFLNICLLLSFLIGYLEWGKGNHTFIFQAEFELFVKFKTNPISVLHPFTLMPFAGQVLLLITVFQRTPNRLMSLIGLGCLSIIMLFLFFIGAMGRNMNILISTLPFLLSGFFAIKYYRRK